jgi:hypothetical protein
MQCDNVRCRSIGIECLATSSVSVRSSGGKLERIILRVLEEARAKGRDHLTQAELAVEAVCEARPDMTASDALAAVNMVRQS